MTSQRPMVERAELAQRGNRDGSPRRRTTVTPRRADDRESLEKIERLLAPHELQDPIAKIFLDIKAAIAEVRDMLGRQPQATECDWCQGRGSALQVGPAGQTAEVPCVNCGGTGRAAS